MAAVSSAPTTTAANAPALTPPHSSHGNEHAWDASGQQVDVSETQIANTIGLRQQVET